MLRYKNSLLERILLEKGDFDTTGSTDRIADNVKGSTFKLNYVPRLVVLIWGQHICHRIWYNLLYSVLS